MAKVHCTVIAASERQNLSQTIRGQHQSGNALRLQVLFGASIGGSIIFHGKNSSACSTIVPITMMDTSMETEGPQYKSIGSIRHHRCLLCNGSNQKVGFIPLYLNRNLRCSSYKYKINDLSL